jgi:hypothetical protein
VLAHGVYRQDGVTVRRSMVRFGPVVDFGPGWRRRPVRDALGIVLREADVAVSDQAADPDNPNRRMRRAYRIDPIDRLRQAGTVGTREVEAARELRQWLERVSPTMGGGGFARVSGSGRRSEPISDGQLRASRRVREARLVLGPHWAPVLWLCLGGTAWEYCAASGMGRRRGMLLLTRGLERLADHVHGPAG